MSARDESPLVILTRHFFQSFFRLSFLDDAGEESFKRAVLGVLAVTTALGLFLTRLYAGKYAKLTGHVTQETFRSMVAADQLLMICLPMLVIGLVLALVSHSIFPDEIDFRTLMALPLSRRTVFAAKFVALFLFAAIFIAGVNLGLTAPLALVAGALGDGPGRTARAFAQVAVSSAASAMTVVSVIAIQGLVIVLAPRAWLRSISVATQTALVCGLVLSVPIIARLPALWPVLQAQPRWLILVPPAWFLGAEHWMLGDRNAFFGMLATAALFGSATIALVAALCGLAVYRRFDYTLLRRASRSAPARWNVRLSWPWARHPAREAIQEFTSATLRRSGLHQLVFFATCAAGSALAVNHLLGTIGSGERWLVRAALGTPLTLMAGAIVGLRAALLLPTNLRASWIFRFTEEAANRRHQLDAVRSTLLYTGVMLPAAVAFPVQASVLDIGTAALLLPVVALLGSIFVELVCLEWRRIPFTCTFLFAKRPPAYTFLLLLLIFGWFVFLGASILDAARSGAVPWLVVATLLSLALAGLGWYRLQTWGHLPFEYEDYLPDGLDTLQLR